MRTHTNRPRCFLQVSGQALAEREVDDFLEGLVEFAGPALEDTGEIVIESKGSSHGDASSHLKT